MTHTLVFALLGSTAGRAARVLVRWLRRGAPVPPPWCEVSLAGSWAVCGWLWTSGRLPGEWLPLLLGLSWLAVAAGAVDLMCHRLPDALTLPAVPLILLLVMPLGTDSALRALCAAVVLAGGHLLVRLAVPAAMGAGDVKLAAPVGAALGAVSWPALAIWAVLAAALTSVMVLAGRSRGAGVRGPGVRGPGVRGPGVAVPHGPAMLLAGWLVVAVAALGAAGATGGPA